jgi:hypothetical protein
VLTVGTSFSARCTFQLGAPIALVPALKTLCASTNSHGSAKGVLFQANDRPTPKAGGQNRGGWVTRYTVCGRLEKKRVWRCKSGLKSIGNSRGTWRIGELIEEIWAAWNGRARRLVVKWRAGSS